MHRHPNFERLEERAYLSVTPSDYLSDYVDISSMTFEPTYATVDAPGNHITPATSQFNGTVLLTIQTNLGTFLGSGMK